MVKKDKVQVEVQVDGKQGINELGKLEMEAKDLRATLKDLKKGTEEYNQVNEKLKGTTAEMGRLREQMGLAGMSMRQLTSYQRDLQKEWSGLTKGTAGFEEVDKKLKAVNSTINQQRAELKGTAGVWGFLKSEVGKFGAIAVGALGFQALTGQISNLISKNAKLSDSLADIRKTTGLSAEGVDILNKKLGELDSRTSKGDLLDIAKGGGQLGIASKDILAFTGAMDKLNVSLGDEFGSAEQITKDMGALRNIFTDIKSDKIDEDMLRIGNAINELGATGAATGDVVADMGSRIGGVGIPLGLTAGQVLGLSATMQELNINTERGSTAVTKILQKMGTDYKEFAKVAGMDTQKFKELLDKDLFGAFTKVIEGVSNTKGGMAEFSKVMDRLKIDGAGASELIGKLGGNMDLLDGRVQLANRSLKNTDSIMNEFNIKNETFGANIDKLQKRFAGMFVNSSIMNGMQTFVGWLERITEVKVSETLEAERAEMNLLVTAIGNANAAQGIRQTLINELDQKYPQILAGLNKETVSNDQLFAALQRVNKEYDKKIALKLNEEAGVEFAKKRRELASEIVKIDKEIANNRNQEEESIRKGLGSGENDLQLRIESGLLKVKKYEKAILKLNQEEAQFIKDQNEVLNRLGIAPGERDGKSTSNDLFDGENSEDWITSKKKKTFTAGEDPDEETKKKGKTDAEKQREANEKALAELKRHLKEMDEVLKQNDIQREMTSLEKRDAELLKVDEEYRLKKIKNRDFLNETLNDDRLTTQQKLDAKKEFQANELILDAQWALERTAKEDELRAAEEAKIKEFKQKMLFETASSQDQELMKIREHYMAIIAEAEKHGFDTLDLYRSMDDALQMAKAASDAKQIKTTKKTEAELLAIKQQHADLTVTVASSVGNALTNIFAATSKNQRDLAIFAQSMAIVEALIAQGVAISKAVAANAASPDPVTFGLRVAASIATIVGTIAGAVATVKSASIPSAPPLANPAAPGKIGGGDGVTNRYYYGGETGGEAGKVVGLVDGEEYVTPSFIRSNPAVINATAVIESVRQNAIRSGNTSSSGSNVGNEINFSNNTGIGSNGNGMLMEMMAEMKMMKMAMNRPVVFSTTRHKEFLEQEIKIQTINQ